jgi:two-component system, chemotaxis family, protein-glutamate methylesterase/glutaminase
MSTNREPWGSATVKARTLRVLVVDDSAVARQLISACLKQAAMDVYCVADPIFAIQRMRTWSPDVIVLDLEMPRMDGLTFLRMLKAEGGPPVVVCSGAAGERSVLALRALEEGAIEVVARPRIGLKEFFNDATTLLNDAVKAAAQSRRPRRRPRATARHFPLTARKPGPAPAVIAIGASTGGTEALRDIIVALPIDAPPVVVVQHMPEGFTAAFANRLDQLAAVRVVEARGGERLTCGTVYIAPGGHHLEIRRGAIGFVTAVSRGPLVSRHRPSVDVLLHSVAAAAGGAACGVILTGMGEDGRAGMTALRAAGARTLAQDEASSVVFGMPKAAIEAGVIDEVLPLPRIANAMLRR